MSKNISNTDQAKQSCKTGVSRCFSVSEDNFTFSENGFHSNLLSNIMGGIRDLTFYNINDKNKNPLKVVGIQLNRGNNFLACYLENGEQRFIYTHYLAVLK